ncbi:anhydro-N-acetylmuramic acid kinase [Roseivirga sp.]|nr:anhydro-N-acetylmuramic acid kinase [Roseivirga sp.]
MIASSSISVEDRMCTFTEHAAIQVAKSMMGTTGEKVLITGGGTYHDYFISRIQALSKTTICIPDAEIINFKEAIIFGYLGLLRHLGQPNCLCSVTGASRNSSGGDIYGF